MIVVVAVRFVNEKRARNEQRKERRERGSECERRRAGGQQPGCRAAGREGREGGHLCDGGRESSRDAELVRVPLLIILIARSKVARGDGGDRGREGEANESRGTDSAANGGSGVARGATIQRYSVKYRTENQDRRTRRELAPRRPRGRERRGAGESAPTAIVDDKEPLPPSSPRAAAARPNARPPAPPLSPRSRDARRGEERGTERALRGGRRSVARRSRSSSRCGSTARREADRRQPICELRGGIVSGERADELACLLRRRSRQISLHLVHVCATLPPFLRFAPSKRRKPRSDPRRCPHFLKMGVVRSFILLRSVAHRERSTDRQTPPLPSAPCGWRRRTGERLERQRERAKKGGSGE